jgi:hypothetical protein
MRRLVLGRALRAIAGIGLSPLFDTTIHAAPAIRNVLVPGIDESTLAKLTGYRITLTFRFQATDQSNQSHNEEIVVTRLINNGNGNQSLTFVNTDLKTRLRSTSAYYHVGAYSYAFQDPKPTSFDLACVPIISEQNYAGYKQMFNPQIYIASASRTTLEKRGVRVSGVSTDQYTVQQVNASTFKTSTGTIWVAQADGYVVAYNGSATGSMQVLQAPMTGTFTWSYLVDAINQSPNITLPTVCSSQQIDADMPIPTGAILQMNDAGSFGFRSTSNPTTIIEFYRTQLPKFGWRLGAPSGSTPGGWLFNITKDRRAYQILILGDGSTGALFSITPTTALPTDQPNNQVPLPSNATNVNRSGATTFLNTPDSVDQVARFYQKTMSDRGWTNSPDKLNLGVLELGFTKGNVRILIRIVARSAGGSAVMIAE